MTKEDLEKEKREIQSKLEDLKKEYSSLNKSDEEYDELRVPYLDRLEELEKELKKYQRKGTSELKKADKPEEELTEFERDYVAMKAAEENLYGELLTESALSFVGIIIIGGGTGYVANNFFVGYLLAGIVAWIVGFRLIGLSVAWGRIRAKRYEIAHKSDESDD